MKLIAFLCLFALLLADARKNKKSRSASSSFSSSGMKHKSHSPSADDDGKPMPPPRKKTYCLVTECVIFNDTPFPCTYPANLPPGTEPGEHFMVLNANLTVDRQTNTVDIAIEVINAPPKAPLTAWFLHFDPTKGLQNAPHAIYRNKLANVDSPVMSTDECVSSGRSNDPNSFKVDKYGRGVFKKHLDYNPLKSKQVPMVNIKEQVTQASFGAMIGDHGEQKYDDLNQKDCCPLNSAKGPTPIAREFIFRFDENGVMKKDASGKPLLARAPTAMAALELVFHHDGLTHGIAAGNGAGANPAAFGDHFTAAMFDLEHLVECGHD